MKDRVNHSAASIEEVMKDRGRSKALEMYAGRKFKDIHKVFLGKIDNFSSKKEKNFEIKHLRAYLKGKQYFTFGKDAKKKAIYYQVLYKFIEN